MAELDYSWDLALLAFLFATHDSANVVQDLAR
jgi:hypothetical protein